MFEIWSIIVSSIDDVIKLYVNVSESTYTTYQQLEISTNFSLKKVIHILKHLQGK